MCRCRSHEHVVLVREAARCDGQAEADFSGAGKAPVTALAGVVLMIDGCCASSCLQSPGTRTSCQAAGGGGYAEWRLGAAAELSPREIMDERTREAGRLFRTCD